VSDFSGGTCSPLESSKIAANTTIYAISTQNITLNETVYMQGTSSKNSTVVASGTFPSGSWQLSPGSTNLWWQVLGSLPNTGTYTMEVTYLSGKNFSSDSFQIVP
jgi:hypothetical protein